MRRRDGETTRRKTENSANSVQLQLQLPTGTELFQPDHYYSGWVAGGVGGVGLVGNKANSVQLQLQLPTGTELGNIQGFPEKTSS